MDILRGLGTELGAINLMIVFAIVGAVAWKLRGRDLLAKVDTLWQERGSEKERRIRDEINREARRQHQEMWERHVHERQKHESGQRDSLSADEIKLAIAEQIGELMKIREAPKE